MISDLPPSDTPRPERPRSIKTQNDARQMLLCMADGEEITFLGADGKHSKVVIKRQDFETWFCTTVHPGWKDSFGNRGNSGLRDFTRIVYKMRKFYLP